MAERIAFNVKLLDAATCPADKRNVFVYDTKEPGLALCVTSNGAKVFYLYKRLPGAGKPVRVRLGEYRADVSDWERKESIIKARQDAQEQRSKLSKGIDPNEEKRAGKAAQDAKKTLSGLFEEYKVSVKLKPKTITDYTQHLGRVKTIGKDKGKVSGMFASWLDRDITTITRDEVLALHAKTGKTAPYMANAGMRVLRALLTYGMGRGWVTSNPTRIISETRAWFPVSRRQTLIRAHQIGPFLKTVETIRAAAHDANYESIGCDYVEFCLFTGLRRNEAATLSWENIDFEAGTLAVIDTKNKLPHMLPLTPRTREILTRRKNAGYKGPWVFPSSSARKGAGHIDLPRRVMKKITEDSGVTFMLHDLRRTFITVAESLDLSYSAVKRLVNHKMSGDVTAGYIIADVERLRKPMQQIETYLLAKKTEPETHKLRIG